MNFIYQFYVGVQALETNTKRQETFDKSIREKFDKIKAQRESKTLPDERQFWEEAEKALQKLAPGEYDQDDLFRLCMKIWKTIPPSPSEPSLDEDDEPLTLEERIANWTENFKYEFDQAIENSRAWKRYKRNLRAFTYYVGYSTAHEEPEENLAELQLFYSTQMPFFKKLQDDLHTQIKLNGQQQEIITALVFRHLTEQLPPSPYKGKTSSTDRWQEFWKDALIKENKDKHLGTHPLTNLHKSLSGDRRVVDARNAITSTSQEGAKGHLYRVGVELFSTLSTNIHKYNGGQGVNGGVYIVGDNQWGKTCRELLRTLVPTEIKNGEVDWDAERKRYI